MVTESEKTLGDLPNTIFTKEEEAVWQPWRKALIVKSLHYSIGYKVLCEKAMQLWNLTGSSHVIDLGFGCFLFRFSNTDDYKNVLT